MTTVYAPSTPQKSIVLSLYIQKEEWQNQFDQLEIWRSRVSQGGPYEALTSASWSPASLPLGVVGVEPAIGQTGPYTAVVGSDLIFRISGITDVTVTFTGSNPLTYAQAATQINAQAMNKLHAFVASGLLFVQTLQPGSTASLQVLGGDAAPLLGFVVGDVTYGTEPYLVLSPDVTNYQFVDCFGDRSYFYKTRFYNSSTQAVSDFSIPFNGITSNDVSPSNLVEATLSLVDGNGKALENRVVLVYMRFSGQSVESKVVAGGPLSQVTDLDGKVTFTLVRGSKVTMAVAGTDLVRDIDVPTDLSVTTFDMFDSAYSKNDLFNVQVPKIDYLVRRTL